MKMAKASNNDMEAALELCRALDVLEDGTLPEGMTEGDDCVFYDADEHAEKVVEHLMSIFKKASLFRVCFGMTVVLDPRNEIVDPNDDCLAVHPKFERIATQRDELLASLKEVVAATLAFPNRPLDDIQKSDCMIDRHRKAFVVAGELITKAEAKS